MNNFRFANSGKRKFISVARYNSVDQQFVFERSNAVCSNLDIISVYDVEKDTFVGVSAAPPASIYPLVEAKQFRITHLEFENLDNPTQSVNISYPNNFKVLGRPVELLASNNEGVDGMYKIPNDHILKR